MKQATMDGWKNYPTKWWAERLAAPRWRAEVVAAAKAARTLDGFTQANLEALRAPEDGLHEWCERWVDWGAIWWYFKRDGNWVDKRPQAFKRRDVA